MVFKVEMNMGNYFHKNSRIIIEAALFSFIILLAVFPDVFFNSGSLRITDQIYGNAVSTLLELPRTTGWWGGYNDNGGASFQAEPIMEFMRYTLESGQSPYWNPFSSAGALGPETLVDQKFSFFTIIYAYLGGGSLVYNVILLTIYFFSLFFLYRTIREVLGLSIYSAIAACVFYLLNGFSVANIGSNIIQSYLYIPICIYFSLVFLNKPTIKIAVFTVLSISLLLSCTFIPTTVTSFIAIYTVIVGYLVSRVFLLEINKKEAVYYFAWHVFLFFLALMLLALLYLPIIENISGIGTLSDYTKRIFFPLIFPQAIASLFSPSHFYESYNSMETGALYWIGSRSFPGNTVYHMGVIGISLASFAFCLKYTRYKWLTISCVSIILLVFLRLFNVVGFDTIFSKLPIVGKLGAQYWWPAIMVPMSIVISLGVQNLISVKTKLIPMFLFILIGLYSFYYIYQVYGLHEPNLDFKIYSLYVIIFIFIFSTFTIIIINNFRFKSKLIIIIILGLFVELLFSSKMMRMQRNDYFSSSSSEITFIKNNIGLYRSLNLGQTGIRPELGSAFQIQEITSMNQGVIPDFLKYYYSAINLEIPQRFGYHETMMPNGAFPTTLLVKDLPESNKIDWDKINLLGVKYIIMPAHYKKYISYFESLELIKVFDSPSSYIFQNPRVIPRAFLVDCNGNLANNTMSLPSDFLTKISPISIDVYENTKVKMVGYSSSQKIAVLTDNFSDNWRATLNGVDADIVKVNGLFRGVVVPRGKFIIKMSYEPKTLFIAKCVSYSVVVLLILMLFFSKALDSVIFKRCMPGGNHD
jgi:hypothetical protein